MNDYKIFIILTIFLSSSFIIKSQNNDESFKFKAYSSKNIDSKQWNDCTTSFTITSSHVSIKADFNILKCRASIFDYKSGMENGKNFKSAVYLCQVPNSRIELMLSIIRYADGEIRIRQGFVEKNAKVIEYKVNEL